LEIAVSLNTMTHIAKQILGLKSVVQDIRGYLHLSDGVAIRDEVGILKELQEVKVILLGNGEDSSFLDCHQWRSSDFR
jgi:hypothetical protein